MKTYYYDIDNARFVDSDGEPINRFVPELFYQERAEWKIALRNGGNAPADLSRITVWGAAVADDFRTDTAPMCRTQNAEIAADAGNGEVTIPLDCATEEFLACVGGVSAKPARFELYGLDSGGRRIVNINFDIRARMTLDPDPGIDIHTPDTVATKAYVSAYVRQSGAIVSGAAIDTRIGPYRITATSGGGVLVSGSGASVVVSGGAVIVSASGASMMVSSESVNLHILDSDGEHQDLTMDTNGAFISAAGADRKVVLAHGGVQVEVGEENLAVNSRPVATQIVTSVSDEQTPNIMVLSGGTSYKYTLPLYSLEVTSVVSTTEASYLHFTLDNMTAPTPVIISGVSYLNSATFEGGKEYLVGFFDGMAVVNEVTQ